MTLKLRSDSLAVVTQVIHSVPAVNKSLRQIHYVLLGTAPYLTGDYLKNSHQRLSVVGNRRL